MRNRRMCVWRPKKCVRASVGQAQGYQPTINATPTHTKKQILRWHIYTAQQVHAPFRKHVHMPITTTGFHVFWSPSKRVYVCVFVSDSSITHAVYGLAGIGRPFQIAASSRRTSATHCVPPIVMPSICFQFSPDIAFMN